MRAMADAPEPTRPVLPKIRPPVDTVPANQTQSPGTSAMVCERCGGGNVYRMHAVWRCADCGFKTDCCGW
jgi:ribosomal protein L37AE/L43A